MKRVALILCCGGLLAGGCTSSDKTKTSSESGQPAPEVEDKKPAPATVPAANAPAAKPPVAASEIDAFARQVLAALAAEDSTALYALALHSADVAPLLETTRKACPDKVPTDTSLEEMAAEMAEVLGTDTEREKQYQEYHAACQKVASMAEATFVKAVAKDAALECGIRNADNIVIEADIGGTPVFVHVDDPMETAAGWKMPESVRCSKDRP